MAKVKEAPPEEVRAAYKQHDEIESNPPSRKRFSAHVPKLDDMQQRVVDDLNRDGYSAVKFSELFGQALWDTLKADGDTYIREIESKLADGEVNVPKVPKPGKAPKPDKPVKEKFFMGRRFKGNPLTIDSPWLQLGASERMLDVVNTYLGMWTKLSYADQWYSPPRGSEADRLGSMRWHRDYNDQHLVKVFVYLVDVDAGTGPFEYVPGSARGGPYANIWPWQPAGDTYPPADEFDKHVPGSVVRTFTAPAGTMIFCNTSGFHRGGFATEKPRSVFVYNFVSPAALETLVDRNFDVSESVSGLPEVGRFALT
jgi:hypothetical protein